MKKKREEGEQSELNLIPMMNLICLLIPFLLLRAQFVQFGIILLKTPKINPGPSDGVEKKDLGLTLVMTPNGYYVKSRFGSECPPGASGDNEKLCFRLKEKGKFDSESVRRLSLHMWHLHKVKYASAQYYKNPQVDRHAYTLVPQHDVRYEDIVKTLDALREIPITAENPPPPKGVPPGGCRMTFERNKREWFVKGKRGEDLTDRACMYHLVTLAVGAG